MLLLLFLVLLGFGSAYSFLDTGANVTIGPLFVTKKKTIMHFLRKNLDVATEQNSMKEKINKIIETVRGPPGKIRNERTRKVYIFLNTVIPGGLLLLTSFYSYALFGKMESLDYGSRREYATHALLITTLFGSAYLMHKIVQRSRGHARRYLSYFPYTLMAMGIITMASMIRMATGPQEEEMFDQENVNGVMKEKKIFVDHVPPMQKPPFPVDVVYTWAGETNNGKSMRTRNNNELKYSLRSVHKYMPWVNRVFIVMNPPKKKPSWFNRDYEKWVTLVDHTDTFENIEHTPSKNSNAIEFTIQNIHNLSEHFVYFNDDFFINQPLPYTHFFTKEGKPILARKASKPANTSTSKLGFKLPKIARGFYLHIPIPLLRSEMKNLERKYPEYVDWVRSHKTREGIGCAPCTKAGLPCPCQQVVMAMGPFLHGKGAAVIKNLNEGQRCTSAYVTSECPGVLEKGMVGKTIESLHQKPPKTFVIQDVASDPGKQKEVQEKMLIFFKRRFPEKPPFEK